MVNINTIALDVDEFNELALEAIESLNIYSESDLAYIDFLTYFFCEDNFGDCCYVRFFLNTPPSIYEGDENYKKSVIALQNLIKENYHTNADFILVHIDY